MDPNLTNSASPKTPSQPGTPGIDPPSANIHPPETLPWTTGNVVPSSPSPQTVAHTVSAFPPQQTSQTSNPVQPQPAPSYPAPIQIPHSFGDIPQPQVYTQSDAGNGDGTVGTIPPEITPPNSPRKFPLMIVTSVVLVIITGFAGSYLYFSNQSKANPRNITTPKITPPVTEEATATTVAPTEKPNPFDTEEEQNPFSSESTYANPFEDEAEQTDAPYQNPFDEQ